MEVDKTTSLIKIFKMSFSVFALFGLLWLSSCVQNSGSSSEGSDSSLTAISEAATDSRLIDEDAEEVRPKKVSILGDSYSTFEGYVPAGNISWYKPVPKEGRPTDVTDVDQTWWKIFIDRNGYVLEKNNSYSGATVCNTGYSKNDYSDRSFVTRLTDIGEPDMILIFGGTNDSWANSPLGEFVYDDWTPTQLYSYRPATAYMVNELKKLHPEAEIVLLINDGLKPEIIDSTIEIADHYGVKYVALSDIEKMSDHPDAKGMVQIADQLQKVADSD